MIILNTRTTYKDNVFIFKTPKQVKKKFFLMLKTTLDKLISGIISLKYCVFSRRTKRLCEVKKFPRTIFN